MNARGEAALAAGDIDGWLYLVGPGPWRPRALETVTRSTWDALCDQRRRRSHGA